MSTLLVKNVAVLATMDGERREISNGGLFIRDGVIEQVGHSADLPNQSEADTVLDLTDHVVIPGLVNTHHHLYQSLTRAVVPAQNAPLFGWLKTLYPIWSRLTSEAIKVSTLTGLAELILSGCTTSSDHLYIFSNDCRLDDEIEAAQQIGMRFHAMRGSMSIGESQGGLPPDSVVEQEDVILKDSQRLIETYHDANPYAMLRVGVAPCSPFSVSQTLMQESAKLARSYSVRLHTHLAENPEDIDYSLAQFGMRPGQYAEESGWLGDDVWHAHCVHLDDCEISLFARTNTGIAHCPCSNMRLGSGIAPLKNWLQHNVPVGLGVDGSASNDSGHLLSEARQAMLLQRVAHGADALTARQTLEVATLGGAKVLGRDDIGALAPGMAADFVAYKLTDIAFAGALHDPIAALLLCQPARVNYSVINGRIIVDNGYITTLDLPVILEQHNKIAQALIDNC